jgi:hypothetical protein
MESVERYLQVFESLRRSKRWSTDSNVLRFAALTLAATETADPGAKLQKVAGVLANEAGGFSPLGSSIRHAVAAILIRRDADPASVVRRIKVTLTLFKEHGLRKGGAHPLLAALLLTLNAEGAPVPREKIVKLKEIIDRWAEDHRFLTGVNDYPMAAMHAGRGVSVDQLGLDVEQSYQLLRKARFSRGNQLQLVSHLLSFSEDGPREASRRFVRLAAALKKKGQRVWPSRYDEVALLVLSGARVEDAVTRVMDYRDRLRAVKPRPQAAIAFSIATGLVLAEEVDKAGGLGEAVNLRAVQSLIEAQQAAMIACMSAVTASAAGS